MRELLILATLVSAAAARMAYVFSSGYEDIIGAPSETFSCEGRGYGYYADMDNACKVFHVCLPIANDEGEAAAMHHFSFFCGNGTVFSQESLTCASETDAFPCQDSASIYDLVNSEFGRIPDQSIDLRSSAAESV
ncbi:U-scoloptoxin(01)-Cw1a-like [Eriocheir sinensis]|uniref:U-scoloptoxin(01)-Cw1a-like n=1 Tax=Eriocheir sinensis TaxID=95602 RepID=UPI0021C5CA60|nr:U-scoloptoxin(01)-Cw1a-like [Eriocheir sinensis]